MKAALQRASQELQDLFGDPIKQRAKVASYDANLRLCLCAWIADAYGPKPHNSGV